jgi:hypothetical protein
MNYKNHKQTLYYKKTFKDFNHRSSKPAQERYNVIIPENLQEIGIKNKNLSKFELDKLKIDYHNINNYNLTTVMIKNIPNKYSQNQLMKEYLDATHEGKITLF